MSTPSAAAPEAAPEAAPAPAPAADKREMQYVLRPGHECVLDLRALARLPANPDDDGVHAFRAIFMQKGRTVHVPDEPGCYATTSPYRIQTAVCIVHFHES